MSTMLEPSRPDLDPDGEGPAGRTRGRRWIGIAAGLLVLGVVAGILLIAGDADSGDPSGSVAVSTPPEELEPAAPDHLEASATSFKVVLTWEPGVGGGVVDQWSVTRDGEIVGIVDPEVTRFVDGDVVTGSTYVYEVAAFDGVGVATDPDRARVRTRPAPPSTAQVKGVYDIRLHVQSSYGITGLEGSTAAWRITPSCDEGACDIRIKVLQAQLPAIEAKHRQGQYEADGSGRFGFACGDVPQTSNYEIGLHPTAADAVGRSWRVTRLEGTLSLSMPEQLGCRSGGVTYSLTGKLVEGV